MAVRSVQRWLQLVIGFILGIILSSIYLNEGCQCECPRCLCPHYTCSSHPVVIPAHRDQEQLGETGWIMDCVTWERKWETSPGAGLHSFRVDPGLGVGEASSRRQETFQAIFQQKDWPAHDPMYSGLQVSGPGAQLKHAQGVMAALHSLIPLLKQALGKSSIHILDVPCGDLQWMSRFLETRDDVVYTGVDIVPELISHHQRRFDRLARAQFIHWDIVRAPLVNHSFDLVLCRDMLQHLWKVDAMTALHNIAQSGASFLLVTTFPDTTHNGEVEKDALGARKFSYNLEHDPFLLESPICTSYDWNVEHLALWHLPLQQKDNSPF